MALAKDNYIDPDSKARWGFGVKGGEVTVGPQTVGETGGVEHALSIPDNAGAHNNGGGDAGQDAGGAGSGPDVELNSLTIPQLKEQLTAKGIAFKSTDAKADLIAALEAGGDSEGAGSGDAGQDAGGADGAESQEED